MRRAREAALVIAVLWLMAVAPTPDAGSAAPRHEHRLVSFAVSPDGRLLATGAHGTADADAANEGVVLWDLATGTARWRTLLPGGVGLEDQLRHGLEFSADGAFLAVNAHTNAVFVLDTATGAVRSRHDLTGEDRAPQHVFSKGARELYVDSPDGPPSKGRSTGAVVAADLDSPHDQPQWLTGLGDGPHDVVSLDAAALSVVQDGKLRSLPRPKGAVTERATLIFSKQHAVAVSRGGLLAAGSSSGELAVFDPVTLSHVTHLQGAPIEAITFGQGERPCVVHQRSATRPTQASVPGKLVPLTFPPVLAPVDWLAFADGLPCAPSVAGDEVLLVLPDGAVERWKASEPPVLIKRVATIPSANAVAWPSPTRAVVLGRSVLAFVELPSGRVISRAAFPP